MNEQDKQNMENGIPEVAENIAQAQDRSERPSKGGSNRRSNGSNRVKGGSKRRKRRSKSGLSVQLVAMLLVITLVFGVVVGYAIGRSGSSDKLKQANQKVDELSKALEEAGSDEWDYFSDELTPENQEALGELSGEAFANSAEPNALVGEDELVPTDAAGADAQSVEPEATTEPVVVAEFDGGQLMSDEVLREYNEQLTTYVFAGYNEEEISSTLLDEVLKYMVSDKVLEAHAKEMGLYDLTDADRQQIETEANDNYNAQLEFYTDYVRTEEMTDEQALAAAKTYLETNEGVTLDSVRTELESTWWAQKLYDEIVKDVSVDTAAVTAAYNEKLAQQQEEYTAYPDEFEYAQTNGETILYNLPGYRAIRVLLLKFPDSYTEERASELNDEIALLDPEKDAEKRTEYQTQLDTLYTDTQARAQKVLDELNAGGDFEQLLDQYGEDEGMRNAALKKTGYYVSENSTIWPAEFVTAAMALGAAGDTTGLVRVPAGVCILEFVDEVKEGPVDMAEVYDALSQEALETAQSDAYDAKVNEWLESAKAVYYPERMQ